MKTLVKKTSKPRRKPATSALRKRPVVSPLELRDAITLAGADFIQRFPEHEASPAELQARRAAASALFAAWEKEQRENPPSAEESASYDRMLERMAAERSGKY